MEATVLHQDQYRDQDLRHRIYVKEKHKFIKQAKV